MNIMETVSTDELLELMNEIYEWNRSDTRPVEKFPKLNEFYNNGKFHSMDIMIKSYITHEAQQRFNKVVPILFTSYIEQYLK